MWADSIEDKSALAPELKEKREARSQPPAGD